MNNYLCYYSDIVKASTYSCAEISFFIEDKIENQEWIIHLKRISAKELPEHKS